ncbi:MAG TPA: hypothetical protein VMH90_04280 [Thermoplasmata archaeon]|nr:hypothetical protein [Thermoplasmata archaeon]
MDVDAVLQSLQERDKWRRRLEVLASSLTATRDRRRRAVSQLKRLRTELRRLQEYSESVLEGAQGSLSSARLNAARDPSLPAR